MRPGPAALQRPTSPEDLVRTLDMDAMSGERLCLSLGKVLGSAFEDFQSLTGSFAAIEAVFNGPEVKALTGAIDGVGQSVAALTSGLDAEYDGVGSLCRLGDDLETRLNSIRRTVRMVSAMATNARVEAASIDSRGGEISSFAMELVSLASEAQASIDGCCGEQARLTRILRRSQQTLAGFRRAHGDELASVQCNLVAVSVAMEAHRVRLGSDAGILAAQVKGMIAAIGVIVSALQIGDSTRQRLQHALGGVVDAARLYPKPDEARVAAAAACGLATLLIEAAREEFRLALESTSASLGGLARQAEVIVDLARQVVGTGTAEGGSFIDDVRVRLRAALDLNERAASARSPIDGAVAEIVRTMAILEQRIGGLSDITEAMTTIGINSVLKAKRIGTAGLGLGVIADQLRTGATSVVGEVRLVVSGLAHAVAETEALGRLFASRHAERMEQATSAANQALAVVAGCDADIRRAVDRLVASGNRVGQELGRSALGVEAQSTADRMDDASQMLSEFASRPGLAPGAIDLARLQAVFASAYTMAAERRIHADFWATDVGSRGTAQG